MRNCVAPADGLRLFQHSVSTEVASMEEAAYAVNVRMIMRETTIVGIALEDCLARKHIGKETS